MKIRWRVEAEGKAVRHPERGLVTGLALEHPEILEQDLRFALRELGRTEIWTATWELLDNLAKPVAVPNPSADRALVELLEQTVDRVRRSPEA
jgi:hypothetical protein